MSRHSMGHSSEALVAVDGAKFKALNNRDRNFTSAKLQRRMEEIESSINGYLAALDTAAGCPLDEDARNRDGRLQRPDSR